MDASDISAGIALVGIIGWIASLANSFYRRLRHGEQWVFRPPWWVVSLFAISACIQGVVHYGELMPARYGAARKEYGVLFILTSFFFLVLSFVFGCATNFRLFPRALEEQSSPRRNDQVLEPHGVVAVTANEENDGNASQLLANSSEHRMGDVNVSSTGRPDAHSSIHCSEARVDFIVAIAFLVSAVIGYTVSASLKGEVGFGGLVFTMWIGISALVSGIAFLKALMNTIRCVAD